MRINILCCSFLLLALGFSTPASGGYVWTQKAAYPGNGKAFGVAVNIKGRIYYGTGQTGGSVYKDWWEFAPGSNTWTKRADFAGPKRMKGVGFTINPYGFVGTGQSDAQGTTLYNDFWRYDTGTNSWIQVAGMPIPRSGAVAFDYLDTAYVGMGNATNSKEFYKYDALNNTWLTMADFPSAGLELASCFAMNGRGYVVCGSNGTTTTNSMWQYNTTNNTWTQRASLPSAPRQNAPAFVIDGKGTVGIGFDENGVLYNDVFQYDRFLNIWQQVDSFPGMARIGATGIAAGDNGYIIGGRDNGQYHDDVWQYSLVNDSINIDSVPEFCEIEITPLATKGKISLACRNVIDQVLQFELYDLKGRQVYNRSFNMQSPQLNLDFTRYREGIYLYIISCNNLYVTSGKLAIIQ